MSALGSLSVFQGIHLGKTASRQSILSFTSSSPPRLPASSGGKERNKARVIQKNKNDIKKISFINTSLFGVYWNHILIFIVR
jgi:hypothetical protein